MEEFLISDGALSQTEIDALLAGVNQDEYLESQKIGGSAASSFFGINTKPPTGIPFDTEKRIQQLEQTVETLMSDMSKLVKRFYEHVQIDEEFERNANQFLPD